MIWGEYFFAKRWSTYCGDAVRQAGLNTTTASGGRVIGNWRAGHGWKLSLQPPPPFPIFDPPNISESVLKISW